MELMDKLDKTEVQELFSRNWLTHDAMWYGTCMQELGPETANRINKTAARLMATVEIRRITKAMGRPKGAPVRTFAELEEIIDTAARLVRNSFLTFEFGFPEKNLLRGRFRECFAYEGVKKYGIIADYECGIVERIKGWLEGLGVAYETTPDFKGCLMHQNGACEHSFRFDLD